MHTDVVEKSLGRAAANQALLGDTLAATIPTHEGVANHGPVPLWDRKPLRRSPAVSGLMHRRPRRLGAVGLM